MKTLPNRIQYLGLAGCLAFILVSTLLISVRGRNVQAKSGSVTYTVTTTGNSGPGSLRQAILNANTTPGEDHIVFDLSGCTPTSPCVISLSSLLPVITDSLTMTGTGMTSLVIDANNGFRGLNAEDVPVSVADLTIQNGNTPGRGAGIRSFGELTLTRVQLLNNHAEDDGGGVFAGGDLKVSDSYIENNTSLSDGGGLYADSGLVLENTEFFSNTANSYGGGAYGLELVSIHGGRFEQNHSGSEGGGLFANDTVSLTGTVFLSNTVDGWGGGLSSAYAWITQAWFESNRGDHGGGIYTGNDQVLENTTFMNNEAETGSGGGTYAFSVVLTNTTFISNTAASSGGGLFAIGNVQAAQTWFEGNASLEDGGGLSGAGDLELTNTTFLHNTASDDGGGVHGQGSIRIVDSSFTGNVAQGGNGGGVSIPIPAFAIPSGKVEPEGGWSLVVTRTQFISNTAFFYGGGIFNNAPLQIASSTFISNQANVGGGVYHGAGDGLVINTLFARNLASVTAAALAQNSSGQVTVKHATIVDDEENSTSGVGLTTGTLFLGNSIITDFDTGLLNVNGTVNQDYNLFEQNGTDIDGTFTGGTHTIGGDPFFINPENDDYHLGAGSAALDAGTDAGIVVDTDGNPRPIGPGFDIGFDEADPITGLAITYSPSPTVTVQTPATFTATLTGGNGVLYAWDFGDGSSAESGNPVTHTYSQPGIYSATVTATNSSGSVSTSVEVEVVQGAIPPTDHKIYLPVIVH